MKKLLVIIFPSILILVSCNQGEKITPKPLMKIIGIKDSIIYDTENNIQSVIKYKNTNKRKVTFYKNGDVDIVISDSGGVNEVIYLNNNQIYKIKKNKTTPHSHDQFLYFDTINNSITINGNTSNGIIIYNEKDSVELEKKFSIRMISIGNKKGIVRYDVTFDDKFSNLIKVSDKKQTLEGLDFSMTSLQKGKMVLTGYLLQYYKFGNSEEVYKSNPFTITFVSR